ncbi:MAG TPA: PAS domain S-box protein, partial [Bryobacteraceae bacterium]|nr:PAS domain S-box protein [Bryobacteraceae bacterium]
FELAHAPASDELALLRRRVAELEAEIERHKRNGAAAEERFKRLADASPVMIWVSGPDALINYFNRSWLEFRGRTLEEESGNGWTEGLHADDRNLSMETYLKSFSARQPFRMQYRLRRANGEYSWVENRAAPYYDGDGRLGGFTGSVVDVSDRRASSYTPDEEAIRMVFSLTERERQVLVLIAQGLSTKKAAAQLGISYKTADSHRSRILEKLGVHETASMVRYAIRAGLIAP